MRSVTPLPMSKVWLAAAAAALCAAGCGGGDPDAAAAATTADASDAKRKMSIPATPSEVDSHAAIDWAEYRYPELFPRGPLSFAVTYLGTRYTARAYVGAWGTRYLGITTDGRIYGMGDFTGNVLQPFGRLTDYAAQVVADRCAAYPGACGSGEPTAPLSVCTMPSTLALAAGSRLIQQTETTGSGFSSIVRSDAIVDGPARFEGVDTIRVTTTFQTSTTSSGFSFSSESTTRSYLQSTAAAYSRSIGSESTTVSPGVLIGGVLVGASSTQSRVVHNPGWVDLHFGLSIGQTITTNVSGTTTSSGTGIPTTTISNTISEVHTLQARETITVRGKSYDTCRFRQVPAPNTGSELIFWTVVGKGVTVRMLSNVAAEGGAINTTTTELVSGTLNGVPI